MLQLLLSSVLYTMYRRFSLFVHLSLLNTNATNRSTVRWVFILSCYVHKAAIILEYIISYQIYYYIINIAEGCTRKVSLKLESILV